MKNVFSKFLWFHVENNDNTLENIVDDDDGNSHKKS